ncbi:Nodule Cysteine-Rich (NCR) secreted peptide [Medicago truncatula]|uniref:Nodule Cysteine-Rich (NCR) secreted peptide n=1 Tax=Medicago truncatula TaxID=3880 RepID=A0A072TVX6_MEDTR|nr:Nodule Cysteine-Rich (NCR) secreted peptide [Medicago truncatula]
MGETILVGVVKAIANRVH